MKETGERAVRVGFWEDRVQDRGLGMWVIVNVVEDEVEDGEGRTSKNWSRMRRYGGGVLNARFGEGARVMFDWGKVCWL
jgi:hypothetical protein